MADKKKSREVPDLVEQRRKAEAKLAERRKHTGPLPSMDTEVQRLVYELEVHQIELEMQNEELLQARTEREAALDHYTDLYDFAPTGYFTLARDSTISKLNLTGAKLLGLERSKLLKKRFGLFVDDEFRVAFIDFLERVFECNEKESFQVELRKEGGESHWVLIEAICTDEQQECSAVIVDLTERKEAEKALINSEERFRELVTTINSGVAIYKVINDGKFGSDYIIQEFNEFSLKHEQMEKKDVIGKSLKDIRPNIDEYGLIDTFRNVWKTGESAFFPAKVYVDDKYSNYYENRVFRLPSGEIVAIYDDVSVQENATAQVKASQERFDLAMKASRDGLFDWNLETNEIYYSPGWKSMLGYEYDEIPNDFSIWETNTEPEDVKRSWEMQQELIDKKRDRFELEFKMKHKDGHWVDILSRAEAQFDENGKAVRIIGTHVDITERKKTEDALIENERVLRVVGRIAKIGGWEIIPETTKIVWSEEVYGIHEVPIGEEPPFEKAIDFFHPDDRPVLEKAIEQAFEKGIPYDLELRLKTRNGKNRITHTICDPIVKDGKVVKLMGTFQDITERKQMEEEKQQMEVHLRQQQKLESIGTLASGVAHEINNPIMGIMNYATLISERLDPSQSQLREFANEIGHETERVAKIVRNLLTFARQEKQSHSPARITDIVDGTLSLIQTIIKRDQITLEVDVPDDLPEIKCRSQQIQQVLMNLLTNARDAVNARYPEYDPKKIINISVHLFEKEGRRWLRTTVEDHGVGIPVEIRERIFDPFYTTKDRATGTGLGLSISLGIVQDHHGELSFESEEGQPTRFHLDLPVDNGWDL